MKDYIKLLDNYIEENKSLPKCSEAKNLLDMLFCCYNQRSCPNTVVIKQHFQKLDEILDILSIGQQDQVTDITCNLCTEFQKEAFREGIFVGFCLYKELQAGR